jgi:transcriptional regulator with XRE-family HTH domain
VVPAWWPSVWTTGDIYPPILNHAAITPPETLTAMTESEISLSNAIGERLRYAREAAGLSLRRLSERTDERLSKSRISNYKLGTRRMGIEEARLLATALGTVTPAFLLCIEDPVNLSADELDLLRQYRATDALGQIEVRKRAGAEARRVTEQPVAA